MRLGQPSVPGTDLTPGMAVHGALELPAMINQLLVSPFVHALWPPMAKFFIELLKPLGFKSEWLGYLAAKLQSVTLRAGPSSYAIKL